MFGNSYGGAAIHVQLVSVSFHRVKQSFVLGIYPVYPNTTFQVYLAKQTSLGICEAFASGKTPKSNVPYSLWISGFRNGSSSFLVEEFAIRI